MHAPEDKAINIEFPASELRILKAPLTYQDLSVDGLLRADG